MHLLSEESHNLAYDTVSWAPSHHCSMDLIIVSSEVKLLCK